RAASGRSWACPSPSSVVVHFGSRTRTQPYSVRIPNARQVSFSGMRAAQLAEENCSIARPASLLGDRWTLVILRQAFSGIKRYEHFQTSLGISRSLLSDRLGKLVRAGILRREPHKEPLPHPARSRLHEQSP